MTIRALACSASMLAIAWSGAAAAQTAVATPPANGAVPGATSTLSEVVVTAERRTTNLQKTAIAATVLTGADLVRRRASSPSTSCSSSAPR